VLLLSWVIRFSKRAERSLKKQGRENSAKILRRIENLKSNPWALPYRKLKGHEGIYRIRCGDFRVIYFVEKSKREIRILRIERRGKVYADF